MFFVSDMDICVFSESNEDESITFGEGDYKLIPCACSDSAIHWHKVGAKLVLQETVANGVSTLNFPYVTLDDAGAYVCKKEDNSNTTIKTVVVVVTPSEIWLLTCYQTFVELFKWK